ncbi:MAG: phenylalanine--tRNA ligase subunit alpha, partial [Spirochaetaceae bacterium]|nr:phenylalanine--tRNA ligase subunit alpha [Spirochaetaceae bacterium]
MSVDIQNLVKNLHPLEVRIVLGYKKEDELSIEKVERELGFKGGNGNQALSWLAAKGIIRELRRETGVFYELTGLGRNWKDNGSPEERIIELIRIKQGLTLPEIAQNLKLDNKDAGSAFGALSKLGVLAMDGEKKVALALKPEDLVNGRPARGRAAEHLAAIRGLLEKAAPAEGGLLAEAELSEAEKAAIAGIAKKRGAQDAPFRLVERETVIFGFTGEWDGVTAALKAAGITGDEIGVLSQEMLETGSWKGKNFRSYNVKVPPTRLVIGRTNPYAKFLEDVKDKLASLGFEEFDGPLVETEFWNSDAL